MTQPQQNPWDVVKHQFIVKGGYISCHPEAGPPTESDIENRIDWTDRIECRLRNGQIIRVRPKT